MINFFLGSADRVGKVLLEGGEVRLARGVIVHVIFKLAFGQTVT